MNVRTMVPLSLVVSATTAFGTLTVTDYSGEKRATVYVDAGEENSSLYLNGDRATWKIQKIGAGEVKILADNKYFGGTIEVQEGTLNSRGDYGNKAFGKPTAVSVSPGATIKFTGSIGGYFHEKGTVLTISGSGVNGIGALYADNSGTAAQLAHLVLAGDATAHARTAVSKLTFNGVLGSSFRTFNLGPYVLTKTGPGTVGFYAGTMSASGTGGLDVTGGLLDLAPSSGNRLQLSGSAGNVLRISNGAAVRLAGIADNAPWTLQFDGVTASSVTNTSQNVWAGPLAVDGAAVIVVPTSSDALTFSGPATSSAALSKRGPGVVVFTGNDPKTFGGNLEVYDGRIEFNGTRNVNLNGSENRVQGANSVLAFVDAGVVTNGSNYGLKVFGTTPASASKLLISGDTVFPQANRSLGEKSSYGSDYRYGIVELGAGAVVSNALSIGEDGYEIGAVYQRGGEWTLPSGSGNLNGRAPIGNAAQGYYELSGGKFSTSGGTSSITIGNGSTGQGLVSLFGGTFLSGPLSFASSAYGNWYHTNGTARVTGGNDFGLRMAYGSGGQAEMTLSGEDARLSLVGGAFGTDFVAGSSSGSSLAILNLNDGATLAYQKICKAANEGAAFYLNCDGGVLKPGNCWQAIGKDDTSNGKVTAIQKPTAVTLYENGLVIDISEALSGSGNPDTTFIDCDLLAPVGGGIVSITPPDLSSVRYIHAPRVHIVGDGAGASAVAVFDSASGRVTGVRVTSPGFGYTQANTTCRIEGAAYVKTVADRAAAANSYSCAITVGAVRGGGLRMRSAGNRLNLSGNNTYSGVTACESGSIKFTTSSAHPANGGLEVWKNADIKFPDATPYGTYSVGSLAGNGTVSQASLVGITNIVVSAAELFHGDPSPLTIANGGVTLASNATVTVTGMLEEILEEGGNVRDFARTMVSKPLLAARDGVSASAISLEMPGLTEAETAPFKVFVGANGVLKLGVKRAFVLIVR